MSNYVLITGGSDGIGLELAKLFAKDKHNLLLAARNIEKLNKAKEMLKGEGVDVRIISVDLSSMEECEKLINYIEDNNLSVDTLVNNAGIGSFGEFKDISWEKEEALIDINIKALSKLTKHFLPMIIKAKQGGILNVASTAAFCSGPKMAAYYGSKAYVLNLTEAIHEEVKKDGIKVSCLCPGPVKTSFQAKAGIEKSESCIYKIIYILRWIFYHKMNIKYFITFISYGLNYRHSKRNIRNKLSIHYIYMNKICPCIT